MKRVLLWTVGIIAVLAVAGAIVVSRIDTRFVADQLAEATARATGQALVLDAAPSVSLFPLGVQFGPLRWGDAGTPGKGMAFAAAGGVVSVEWQALLSGNVVIREIKLDRPELVTPDVTVRCDGAPVRCALNISLGEAGSTVEHIAGSVQAGEISIVTRNTGKAGSAGAGTKSDATQNKSQGKRSASGSKAKAGGKQQSATDATDTAPPTQEQPDAARSLPQLDISIALAAVRHDGLVLRDISGTLAGKGGAYTLDMPSATLGSGGSLAVRASTNVGTKHHALRATARGVNVGGLLAALGKGRMADGTARAELDVTANGHDARALLNSLNGKGEVAVQGLTAQALQQLPAIPGIAPIVVPARIDSVHAPFTVRNGEVVAQPIEVASATLSAAGRAQASLPRQYLHLVANVTTHGVTVPLIVQGPFNNIQVGLDPKFALELTKQGAGALLDGGQGAAGLVRDGAQGAGSPAKKALEGAGGLVRGLFKR